MALKDAGTLLAWETGLHDLYKTYSDRWGPGRFSDLGERRTYANFFLVTQAKKARADIALEAKRAVETAEKAKKEVKAKKEKKEAEAKKQAVGKAIARPPLPDLTKS